MRMRAATHARILRIRKVQHLQAAGHVAQASERLGQIIGNKERLVQLRLELEPVCGPTSGAALAQAGEMAMRLGAHDEALAAVERASRDALDRSTDARIAAQIAEESSKTLFQRARRAEAVARDARSAAPRGRSAGRGEEEA